MGRLDGKVAVVTGSNGSIGAAVAQAFLKEGAKVVLTEFRSKGAAEVAKATGISDEYWMVQQLDASDRTSVDNLIAATLARFGRLDVFMAHAGSDNRRGHFFDLTDDDFDYLMKNNCKSVFMCSQAAAKAMVATGGGSIIHTSSVNSLVGRANSVVYGTTKGAITAMTRHMAHDLARYNIRVNTLLPGVTRTKQIDNLVTDSAWVDYVMNTIPMKRFASPEDMVGACLFLASDESSYVTGTYITVDGGIVGLR
ncbi:MAG: glucose 1-dehydrogenase [Peptococcaceae bacterium]|jgi:2-deoxy-D-gluconate 3-dehydrogenase|nr:glucose 1-dehydrogenase [Peptococcaceae bacterium]